MLMLLLLLLIDPLLLLMLLMMLLVLDYDELIDAVNRSMLIDLDRCCC